jgi:hypothetical protein
MAMFEKIRRDPCSMEKTIRLPPYSPETQGRQREGESGRISKEALARASGAGTREHPLLDKGILSPTEFPWAKKLNLDASVHPVAPGSGPKRVRGSGPEENALVTTAACLNSPPPFQGEISQEPPVNPPRAPPSSGSSSAAYRGPPLLGPFRQWTTLYIMVSGGGFVGEPP